MKRRTKLLVLVAVAILVALLQTSWLSKKVRVVDSPELHAKHDFELSADSRWRYGYSHGNHGASLVKTANRGEQSAGRPSENTELRDYMRRELDRLPWLAIREGTFYLAFAAALLFVGPDRDPVEICICALRPGARRSVDMTLSWWVRFNPRLLRTRSASPPSLLSRQPSGGETKDA